MAVFLLTISSLASALVPFVQQQASAAVAGDVWITAAMPDPASGEPEYVKIKNNSGAPIDMNGWVFNDGTDRTISPAGNLAAGASAVLCDDNPVATTTPCDSRFFQFSTLVLNDGGDTLTLKDDLGNIIDQVSYASSSDGAEIPFTTHTLAVASTLAAEEFVTTDGSYKGISVGFNAKDFSNISAVTVDMTRNDGSHAIKHGTQNLFDLIESNASPYKYTAPFVIQAGSYNPSTDSYWTSDATSWSSSTIPTSVTITITDENGNKSVTNTNFLQNDASHPAYQSLLPPAPDPVENVDTGETFDTIQAAIDDSDTDNGDTIKAAAGTYPEQVSIDKSLTLLGANATKAGNDGSRTTESIISGNQAPDDGNGIKLTNGANNVTIAGFEFTNTSGILTVEHGVVVLGQTSGTNNVTIKNNRFVDMAGRGILKESSAKVNNLQILNNDFENIGTTEERSAMKLQYACSGDCGGGEISGNTIDGTTYAGIILDKANNFTLENNTIKNVSDYGIGLRANGGDVAIKNNTFVKAPETGGDAAIRIKDGGSYNSLNITGNTIQNSSVGLLYESGNTVAGDFNVHKNKFENISNIGVKNEDSSFQLDALNNWWGDASGPTDNVDTDNSSPLTNPGGLGAEAKGNVKYDTWCANADCTLFGPDVDPPVVDITSHDDGDSVNGSITIEGVVTDGNPDHYWFVLQNSSNSTVAGPSVVYDNNSPANPSFIVDTTSLPDGDYTIKLEARDAAGNKDPNVNGPSNDDGVSVDWAEITIDNTAPAIPVLLSPGNGVPVQGNNLVNDWQDVADADHYVYQSYNIDSNGNCNLSDIRWTQNYTDSETNSRDVGDLTYCWRVKAVDATGNESGWSQLWKTVVDNTAPTAPHIVTPTDEQYFNSAPILNDWTNSSDTNGIDHYQIEYIYDDGHHFINGPYRETPGNQSQRNHQPGSSEQGGVKVRVRAYDQAGNVSAWSAWVHYFYDAIKPSVPTGGQPHNTTIDTNNFSFTWNASSDDSPITYEFQSSLNPSQSGGVLNSGVWNNIANGNAAQNHLTSPTIPSVGAPDGTWYWQVRAIDAAGNKSNWSDIWNVTLDTQAPDVTINSFSANNNVITPDVTAIDPAPGTVLTYAWTANDPDSTNNVTISDATELEPDFTANADGTYSFTLTVTDAAGNSTAKIFSFTYTTPLSGGQGGINGFNGGGINGGEANNFTNVTVAAVNPGGGAATPQAIPAAGVLGAQTDNANNNNKNESNKSDKSVLGDSTSKDSCSKLFGICWYYWVPIVIVIAGIAYYFFRRRQTAEA